MKLPIRSVQKALELLFPPDPESQDSADRSGYERFAIPFEFKPHLSFLEAVVEVTASFLRIVLGCVLFAVWGAYSLEVWFGVPNLLLRSAILLSLLAAFLVSLFLMLLVIAACVRVLLPAKSYQV